MENQDCCSEKITKPLNKTLSFKECPIEEKIARLHGEVIGLRYANQYKDRMINELMRKFRALENHQHSKSGECMIKISNETYNEANGMGGLCAAIDYLA